MTRSCLFNSPLGPLTLTEADGALARLDFGGEEGSAWTPLLRQAAAQLEEYFAGSRTAFDLPLAPKGTDFQRRVWDALREIPYGQTRSYGELAAALGNSKASRAVGMANNKNPLPIFIPCHRVIGSNGALTGYAWGMDIKARLLQLEGIRLQ